MRNVRQSRNGVSSFLDGMAMIFDFGGTLHPQDYKDTGWEDDAAAIASDWVAVGDDLRSAISEFEHQESERIDRFR